MRLGTYTSVAQILRQALHHEQACSTELTLLYGAVDESELLFKDLLITRAKDYPNLKVAFYLNNVCANEALGSCASCRANPRRPCVAALVYCPLAAAWLDRRRGLHHRGGHQDAFAAARRGRQDRYVRPARHVQGPQARSAKGVPARSVVLVYVECA